MTARRESRRDYKGRGIFWLCVAVPENCLSDRQKNEDNNRVTEYPQNTAIEKSRKISD